MSDGKKAAADEEAWEAYERGLAAFKSKTDTKQYALTRAAADAIDRLMNRELRLTRTEHDLLDQVRNILRTMLEP